MPMKWRSRPSSPRYPPDTVTGSGSPWLMRKATSTASLRSWATMLQSRHIGMGTSVPGRHNHRRFALPPRVVGGEQQSLWPFPVVRCRTAHQRSVHGQGLEEVRLDGRLGVRTLPGRQTWRRDDDEDLLPLPRADESSRPCLHAVRACTTRCGKQVSRVSLKNPRSGRSWVPSRTPQSRKRLNFSQLLARGRPVIRRHVFGLPSLAWRRPGVSA